MDDKENVDKTIDNTTNSPRENLTSFTAILAEFNSIRENLARLPLNPEEKAFIDTYIQPLSTVLYQLSTTSLNLTDSTKNLSTSYITSPKKSKIEDTEELVYDMNKTCAKIFKVIKKRLDIII